MDGICQAINVKNYHKPTITEYNAGDVHRFENTLSEFNELRGKINDHLNFVSEMRRKLFGQ